MNLLAMDDELNDSNCGFSPCAQTSTDGVSNSNSNSTGNHSSNTTTVTTAIQSDTNPTFKTRRRPHQSLDVAIGRPRRVGSFDGDDMDVAMHGSRNATANSTSDANNGADNDATDVKIQPQTTQSTSDVVRTVPPTASTKRNRSRRNLIKGGGDDPLSPQLHVSTSRTKKPASMSSLPTARTTASKSRSRTTSSSPSPSNRSERKPRSHRSLAKSELAGTHHPRARNTSSRQKQPPERASPRRTQSDSVRQTFLQRQKNRSIWEDDENDELPDGNDSNNSNNQYYRSARPHLHAMRSFDEEEQDSDNDDMPSLIPMSALLLEERVETLTEQEKNRSRGGPTRVVSQSNSLRASARSTRTTGSTSSSSVSISSSSTGSTGTTGKQRPRQTRELATSAIATATGGVVVTSMAPSKPPRELRDSPPMPARKPPASPDSSPDDDNPRSSLRSSSRRQERKERHHSSSPHTSGRRKKNHDASTKGAPAIPERKMGAKKPLKRILRSMSESKLQTDMAAQPPLQTPHVGQRKGYRNGKPSSSSSLGKTSAKDVNDDAPASAPAPDTAKSSSSSSSMKFLRKKGRLPPQPQSSFGSRFSRKTLSRNKSDLGAMTSTSRGKSRDATRTQQQQQQHRQNTIGMPTAAAATTISTPGSKKDGSKNKLFSMSGIRKSFSFSKGKKSQSRRAQASTDEGETSIGDGNGGIRHAQSSRQDKDTSVNVAREGSHMNSDKADVVRRGVQDDPDTSGLSGWIKPTDGPTKASRQSEHSRTQHTETTATTMSTWDRSESNSSSNSMGYFLDDSISDGMDMPPPSQLTNIVEERASSEFSERKPRARPDAPKASTDLPPSPLLDHLEKYRETKTQSNRIELDEDDTIISDTPLKIPQRRTRSSSPEPQRMYDCHDPNATTSHGAGAKMRGRKVRKSVLFDRVIVREYERCVGDSPAVSSGPPIGLDWGYYAVQEFRVEVFENNIRRPGPRTRRDFFLSPQKRFHMLLDEWGFSVQEICEAKDEAAEIRHQRHISAAAPSYEEQDRYQPASESSSASSMRDVPPKTMVRRRTIDNFSTNAPSSNSDDPPVPPAPPSSRGQDRWNPCPSPVSA